MKIKADVLPTILAFCLCLLVSYFYFGSHLLMHMNTRVGGGGDSGIYVWSLAWWKYAIVHHINPLITNYIWYPSGFNLARATSVPGVFILTFPIQLFWGMEAAYNVMFIIGPGLAAWTMFLLCYYLFKTFWPSLLAGMLFGFSGYMIGQMHGHLNLTAGIFLIPIMVLLVLRLMRSDLNHWVFVAGMTLCLALSFLISIEIFLTFTLCGTIAGVVAMLVLKEQRQRIYEILPLILLVYGIVALIISPYLYYFFTDHLSGHYVGIFDTHVNDVLSFFIPTRAYLVKNSGTMQLASLWTGNPVEQDGYLGVPLLLIVAVFCKQHWSASYAKYLMILFLIFMVISLGPTVHISGVDVFSFQPNQLFFKMPLLKWSLASRYALYTSMIVAFIVAYWLTKSKHQWFCWPLVIVAILFLMPTQNLKDYHRYQSMDEGHYPAFFSQDLYKKWLEPGESILVLPFNVAGIGYPIGLYYQAKSHFYFKMANGVMGPPPQAFSQSIIDGLVRNHPDQITPAQLIHFLQQKQVAHLVIIDHNYSQWKTLLSKLNITPLHVGGVRLYDLSR